MIQQKTKRPVQFEITELTRQSVKAWIGIAHLRPDAFLFPSRISASPHLSTRPYARIVHRWVADIGLDVRRMAPIPCGAPAPQSDQHIAGLGPIQCDGFPAVGGFFK